MPIRFSITFMFSLTLSEGCPVLATLNREVAMLSEELLREIESGQGETLSHAARRVPRTRQGKAVSLSCLLRWVQTGVRGPGGHRIKLEAARLAGKWVTTPGAIRRFVVAQTQSCATEALPPRSPTRRHKASERAARELDGLGI